ncbi:MAG: HAMP domain-containing sensor histidine kinase [Crocinitomicaceae bacterium]
MKRSVRNRFVLGATLGFLFWIFGALLFHFQLRTGISEADIESLEIAYQERCIQLEEDLPKFVSKVQQESERESKFNVAIDFAQETRLDLCVYHNDSLKLWTSNSANIPLIISDTSLLSGVNQLENGWYQVDRQVQNDSTFIAFFKIKNEYKYENEDLVNHFDPEIIEHFHADLTLEERGYPIIDNKGDHVFSLVPVSEFPKHETTEIVIFFCYLFAFVILIQLLINAIQKLLIRRPILLVIFPITIVVLRYLWLRSEWDGFLKDFELFNPELFASSYMIPSLGDLIINVTIFYFLVHFLLKRTRNWFKQGNKKMKLVFFVVPLFLVSFYAAFRINDIIYSLVYDSKMSFDLEELFDFSIYSFISVIIIGASFYAYFRLIQYIIIQLKKNDFEWNRLAFLWALSSGVYIAIDQFYFDHSILTSFWPVILSGSLLWFQFKEKEYKFVHIVSLLAFIAFYAAYILQGYADNNERELRMAEAEMIAKDKDPFSEYEYDQISRNLSKDSALIKYFEPEFSQTEMSEELESSYFKKLKDDYDLTFYLYGKDKRMVVDFGNYELKDYSNFKDIIDISGVQSAENPNIYFIKDYTDKLTYIAKQEVYDQDSIVGYLITEMRSKKFPEDIGLPSLLLDEGTNTYSRLSNYSIAKYVDNRLVSMHGDFAYATTADEWTAVNKFTDSDGYSHYVYQEEEGFLTVISKKLKSNRSLFTSFSYLLIIFGGLILLPLIYREFETGISFKNMKLNVKIQAVMIGMILITLIAFAVGAGAFVEDQYNESNQGFIKEKLGSVKTELESKLKTESELKPNLADYLEYILKKFSKVFVTDINVYNSEGDLLASSQPKIYSKGLISRKMNTQAFEEVHLNKKSEYVHQESIGELSYLSAYMPFLNQKGEFLGYANVQYISKQDEFEDQISGFLLAIIDIMVLMLAISTILAIVVSNRVTRPLKYIQDSMKGLQIGSRYKPIEYEGKDEIGELVKEYNKKVRELQDNAEALAKSERESAWREMAKQVAHEIKNPLTPMKLSIQHLKRTIKVADEESNEKLDRVSKSLIEQIDTLTNIANEFSTFAKMPKPIEAELNLSEIVKNTVAVFTDTDEYDIHLEVKTANDAIIWADKDLLLRVFNNLIKNAIQAVPMDERGNIQVVIEENQDRYIVSVKDNGVGIEPDAMDKIFVPYFTTKSKGTGLGLAMSKQIVEGMRGQIWFESEVGVGTTFYVSFPFYKN